MLEKLEDQTPDAINTITLTQSSISNQEIIISRFKWIEYLILYFPLWCPKYPSKSRSNICHIIGFIYYVISSILPLFSSIYFTGNHQSILLVNCIIIYVDL